MLFLVKRDVKTSLITAGLLAVAAYVSGTTLGLSWPAAANAWHLTEDGLFGLAVLLASDASLHTLLSTVAPGRYSPAFEALAGLFAEQTPLGWLAGGVTAGAEELIFRGVLVGGGIHTIGLSPIVSAGLAALAFGAAHLLLTRRLWAFSIWATWEGFVLGLFYLASGSLGAVMLAHGLHDILGFWFFHWSRQRKPR